MYITAIQYLYILLRALHMYISITVVVSKKWPQTTSQVAPMQTFESANNIEKKKRLQSLNQRCNAGQSRCVVGNARSAPLPKDEGPAE